MAPIIIKMETAIKTVSLYNNKLPSYVNNFYVNICNWKQIQPYMKAFLKKVDEMIYQMIKENYLSLEESKHKTLVLRKKRQNKNKDIK